MVYKKMSENVILVKTEIEYNYFKNSTTLSLGNWCKGKKNLISSEDSHHVVASYGCSKEEKDIDFNLLLDLEEKIFPDLVDVLNRAHCLRESNRYWKILIGHWLRDYLTLLINRVKTLEKCFSNYSIDSTPIVYCSNDIVCVNTIDLCHYAVLPLWNSCLYGKIINIFPNLKLDLIPLNLKENIINNYSKEHLGRISLSLEDRLKRFLHLILPLPVPYQKVYIDSLPLTIKQHFLLHLLLGQLPGAIRPLLNGIKSLSFDKNNCLRNNLSMEIAFKSNSNLEFIARNLLFEIFPLCYLEGFTDLQVQSSRLSWPKRPELILSKTSFYFNELFKVWTAYNVSKGTKYYVYQHGNNYGTHRYRNKTIEEVTCDKYLTWGWKDNLECHLPTLLLNNKLITPKTYNKGKLLLVQSGNFRSVDTFDIYSAYIDYFKQQMLFVDTLDDSIRKDLVVRLYSQIESTINADPEHYWKKYQPNITLDKGSVDYNSQLKYYRLIIFTMDSTGILEALYSNRPVLAFWEDELDHLRNTAIPYYQLLVDSGIIHLNPASASDFISEIWNDVGGWWNSIDVQNARTIFCNQYALYRPNPMSFLARTLNK